MNGRPGAPVTDLAMEVRKFVLEFATIPFRGAAERAVALMVPPYKCDAATDTSVQVCVEHLMHVLISFSK